jgi:hypothetical protein
METPMKTKILAIATVLAATATLTSVAEAGGNGVRLGFGFPMGSFTATPARGGSYAAAPSAAQAMAAKKKAAMQAAAARRASGSTAKVTKTSEENKDKDTAESTPTGSTALVQTATLPAASDASSTPQADATSTTVAATTEPAAPAAPAVTEEKKAEETKETKDDVAAKVSDAKDLACKKFFPAVGLTLSVGCKE